MGMIAMAATVICLFALSLAGSAQAETAVYRATQVVPVPPASNYAGGGGGDGWAVALSSTAVYNVFHHESQTTVNCHLQSDASTCVGYPKTITETGTGAGFVSQGQPGLYLNQGNGHLYVMGTRTTDKTGGVVCIDTTSTEADPFCGFTPLTGAGESPPTTSRELSSLSVPVLIGTHWYAFNYVAGEAKGTENALNCFDVATGAACAGQPYAVSFPSGTVSTSGNNPTPAIAAIGGKVIIPINISTGSVIACFDDATHSSCAGKWPVPAGSFYQSGSPYPMLNTAGEATGVCLPTGTDPCVNLAGESVETPAGMTEAIHSTSEWNGPSFELGPRVYVPNGETNKVECYDYSTGTSCVNFPKVLNNLYLLYTVNPDPQRPTCIWVNSDSNTPGQIQNFDAYTGESCGSGVVRVLTSQFALPECKPANYVSIQILKPAGVTGSVAFADGDGNPIPGLGSVALDATGTASLAGLPLNTATGLPQFLFTLSGGTTGEVEVQLTWTGDYSAACSAKVITPPATTPPPAKKATGGVEAFGAARLASATRGCVASSAYSASVRGKLIASVTFTVNGRKVGMLKKPNGHGSYTAHINVPAGHAEKLVIHVVYTSASKVHSATLRRTLARCAARAKAKPRFTG